eukprot:11887850-Karenia_brevis.AAC.1
MATRGTQAPYNRATALALCWHGVPTMAAQWPHNGRTMAAGFSHILCTPCNARGWQNFDDMKN